MELPFSRAFISDTVSSNGKLLDIVLRLDQSVFEVCLSYMKGFFFEKDLYILFYLQIIYFCCL